MQELSVTTTEDRDPWFVELWLHDRPAHTQEAYRFEIWQFKRFCGKSLPQVTLEDLQIYEDYLKAGLSHASRNRALAAIKSALSFGASMKYLPTNVGLLLKLRRPEDRLAERIMSEQAVDDILRLESNPRNHALLSLLYYGGLRASEVCNLTWRNLQERNEAGQIAVYGKGDKTRFVLLDSETWRKVWIMRRGEFLDSYVFPSRQENSATGEKGRRLDESTVHRIVRRAADRAGIAMGKVSPHWLRHAHATHAIEAGADITLVGATLGHKAIETTARYTHVRPTASSSTFLRARHKTRHERT
jgi:integrase/recombinase XerD